MEENPNPCPVLRKLLSRYESLDLDEEDIKLTSIYALLRSLEIHAERGIREFLNKPRAKQVSGQDEPHHFKDLL